MVHVPSAGRLLSGKNVDATPSSRSHGYGHIQRKARVVNLFYGLHRSTWNFEVEFIGTGAVLDRINGMGILFIP
jgi:hypothetical protein